MNPCAELASSTQSSSWDPSSATQTPAPRVRERTTKEATSPGGVTVSGLTVSELPPGDGDGLGEGAGCGDGETVGEGDVGAGEPPPHCETARVRNPSDRPVSRRCVCMPDAAAELVPPCSGARRHAAARNRPAVRIAELVAGGW